MAAPPVVLRIKVRYEQSEAFVERFAPYVARAGLFLRSKQPKPVGTEVRFELRLADDKPVLVGMGIVRWAREPDPDKPYQPPGMAIEFTRVTKESREVILKMLELRRKLQLVDGPRGLPNPPDDDVAITAASTASATAAQVQNEAPPQISNWRRPTTTALEPMAARPRRAAPSEVVASVITSASAAPLADAFGEIEVEDANLPGVLARARALVGADVDRELAALLEDQAVPVEHDIEEVSARLASLLGTAPVSRRNRRNDSVRTESKPSFAPPPKVALQIAADLVPAPAPAPPKPDSAVTKVVSLEAFAQMTESATRVVNLESLAATTAPDADERTKVRDIRDLYRGGDDERTAVISARDVERATTNGEDSPEDTLDFDRPAPTVFDSVPREFEREPEQDTNVRARPKTRSTPPPPPKRPTPSPFTAVDPDDEEAPTTAEPVTGVMDFREKRLSTDSGSIDLTDLVSEADADLAQPVPLGKSLDGEARDAADLINDVSSFDRRRAPAPEGPYPDLASFADPPAAPTRARPESLDAALAALEDATDDDDGGTPGDDVHTSYQRPPSGGRAPSSGSSVAVPIDDDDDLDIEIEFDDE